jgi:hypothetical protein
MSNDLHSKVACLPTPMVAFIVLVCASAVPARSGLGNELFKLTAADPAPKSFANSISVSGNTAIVGAHSDYNHAASSAGAAYLFDVATGQQAFKLTASDAAEHDIFGLSVAISGNLGIVGAPGDDDGGDASGSAYLFNVVTGQQLFKLTASDARGGRIFGTSVAISGNRAIVGAPWNDVGVHLGSAYLFDVTTGQEQFKLTAPDANPPFFHDKFGSSVAIGGNTAIVGDPLDNDAGVASGAAYLFDVTTGQQLFKLTASDAASGDEFGGRVAISGNTAIVGALGDRNVGAHSGSAYLFDVITGQELMKLTASDAAAGNYFGISVAISGNLAVIGASRDAAGINDGSAYLFDVTTGHELAKLTASDAEAGDEFGGSVTISGNLAVIGAPEADQFYGAAYVFSIVPEPASLALLALGVPILFWRKSRRCAPAAQVARVDLNSPPRRFRALGR